MKPKADPDKIGAERKIYEMKAVFHDELVIGKQNLVLIWLNAFLMGCFIGILIERL